MSVVGSARELDLKGDRSFVRNLESGETGQRTFQVTVDSSDDNESVVLSAFGLPLIGESKFPGSTIAICYDMKPEREKGTTRIWRVVCQYKSQFSQKELSRIVQPNPLDRKTVSSGQFRAVEQSVRRLLRTTAYRDYTTGLTFTLKDAANSAGDPLDPPVTQVLTEAELRFRKNVTDMPTWFMNIDLGYHNGVNNADQTIYILNKPYTLKKGTASLGNFSYGEPQRENGIDFVSISWSVYVKKPRPLSGSETEAPSPWDVERLDEGMRTRDTVSGETLWKNVRDRSNQSIMLPVPFDGSGQPITTSGAAIAEDQLYRYLYRPRGNPVDYSVIQWQ